jgi:hypothetical protein
MKISKLLGAIMLSFVFGFQSSGDAQTNLVNFSEGTWTITYTAENPNQSVTNGVNNFASVSLDCNSATFQEGGGNDFDPSSVLAAVTLTGILNTTPGTAYEITYTMQNPSESLVYGSMSFGNFNSGNNFIPNFGGPSINFDFTTAATSQTTAISFDFIPDDFFTGLNLSNVSVVEVPEISSAKLLAFLGCAFLRHFWASRNIKPGWTAAKLARLCLAGARPGVATV